MAFQSTSPSTTAFLLHPDNHAFVTGQRQQVSNSLTTGWLALFMVGFVVFGVVFFAGTAREVLSWWAIESSGFVTSGELVERRASLADSVIHHHVTIRYFHEQIPYETEHRIDQAIYDRLSVGSQVDVRFLPHDPYVATIVGSNPFPTGIVLFVLIWNAVVLKLAVDVWRQYWLLRVLEHKGIVVQGTITRIRATSESNGDLLLHVDYCFQPPDANVPISGNEKVVRNDLKHTKRPMAGNAIHVLYHHPQHYLLL